MISPDTIVALSSAVGSAPRMIVRMSGGQSIPIANRLTTVPDAPGNLAFRSTLNFANLSLEAWVYLFRGPASYTGQDIVELHLPGNPVLIKLLIEHLVDSGARPADPGEFTARAYFNGRMDLAAAEGVAATIAASNESELFAARQLLAGELARRLTPVMEAIADTLALLEVGIDFSEEDVSFLAGTELRKRIDAASEQLERLLKESSRFERLAHEPRVVLAGRPNAGKSTLLNALAGQLRAVVSPIPGTTRDVLSAKVALPHGMIVLLDVAGLSDEETAACEIDRKMRQHAVAAITSADVVVLVRECIDPLPPMTLPRSPQMVIISKGDLLTSPRSAALSATTGAGDAVVSAATGAGLHELRSRLDGICFGESSRGSMLALNARHVGAINEAAAALARAAAGALTLPAELLALDLREAIDALGSILGRMTPDDLLGRIFSGFCIGK